MAWDDGGLQGAALYLLLLLLCVFQCIYPTLLVWALLLSMFVAYTVTVAVTPENGTRQDYFVFLLCGAVPAAFLLLLFPGIRKSRN